MSKMTPILYAFSPSPPVRAVQMLAKALGLTLLERTVDLFKQDNLAPEFIKINPQHTVPTLIDDGFTLWDSHAINAYLVSKYAKSHSLYPQDLKMRALIDQRLHFDSGVAFPPLAKVVMSIFCECKKTVDEFQKISIRQVYGYVETFLENRKWIAGDSITIADYSLYATLTTLNVIVPIDASKYEKMMAWIKNIDRREEAEPNKRGLAIFTLIFRSRII